MDSPLQCAIIRPDRVARPASGYPSASSTYFSQYACGALPSRALSVRRFRHFVTGTYEYSGLCLFLLSFSMRGRCQWDGIIFGLVYT
jgi:hypothetical protein